MYYIIQEAGGRYFYMCNPEGDYRSLLSNAVGKRLICIAESFKIADLITSSLNQAVKDKLLCIM